MPWNAAGKNLGFSTATPWLPLGPTHAALAVSKQEVDSHSVLAYARKVLSGRRGSRALTSGGIAVVESPAPMLAYVREYEDERVLCVFNMSREAQHFEDPRIATGQVLEFGCGTARVEDGGLTMGSLSAWFARV